MNDSTTKKKRPLAPHLDVYRWSITMATSILHRITGIVLSIGMLFIAIWLILLAYSPTYFNKFDGLIDCWFIKAVLFLYSFALAMHAMGGVKYLIWDVKAHLLEKHKASKIAWHSILGAVLITIAAWLFGYFVR